jgi:hypothetical protein
MRDILWVVTMVRSCICLHVRLAVSDTNPCQLNQLQQNGVSSDRLDTYIEEYKRQVVDEAEPYTPVPRRPQTYRAET